jgi:hypothetical protein
MNSLEDLPRPALIGGGIAIVIVLLVGLFFFINSFVTPLIPRSVDHVPPPPGYPDQPPYNTKAWQDLNKRSNGNAPHPPPGMGF